MIAFPTYGFAINHSKPPDMRKGILLLLPFVLFGTTTLTAKDISLEEAVRQGLVTVSFTGMTNLIEDEAVTDAWDFDWGSSPHYGKCINMIATNNTSGSLSLTIENGRILNADDPDVQDMIITQQMAFTLPSNQKKEYALYAMCTEMSDMGPDGESLFTLGLLAEPDLRGMSELVEKHDAQNETGQDAVWVITDDMELESIDGDDPEITSALRHYAAKVTGKTIEPELPYNVPLYNGAIEFGYRLMTSAKVSLIVYDPDGSEFKVLFAEKPHERGDYSIKYSFDRMRMEPGVYTLKMFKNGVFQTFSQFQIGN